MLRSMIIYQLKKAAVSDLGVLGATQSTMFGSVTAQHWY